MDPIDTVEGARERFNRLLELGFSAVEARKAVGIAFGLSEGDDKVVSVEEADRILR